MLQEILLIKDKSFTQKHQLRLWSKKIDYFIVLFDSLN
jgi:hypothetical protein